MMFNLTEYYNQAHSGEKVDNSEVLQYIKSFKKVVIWGGSYLGSSVGKYLLNQGISIEKYWDIRAEELKEVNGIQVIPPFSSDDKENTLVIFCIGNNVIMNGLLYQLKTKGYRHILRGDYFYMGALCPFDVNTDINAKQCQGTMCCRAVFCQRLSNIVKNRNKVKDPLHMYSMTFSINQKCSLKCKLCTSYMNEYPLDKRINVPVQQVLEDIDKFFAAMDSLGTITVMGGEPFMHPDLDQIMTRLLSKNNFGLVSIATSGTYPIDPEILPILKDPRVNISFSNYTATINQKQRDMFEKNVALVKKSGVSYTVGVIMGTWSVPSNLYDLGDSEEVMIAKKNACVRPPGCMQTRNGKIHPCDFGSAIYNLGIADYEMDYVDMTKYTSMEELKQKIRDFLDQPYYRICGHCQVQGLTDKAAEQGYHDFKTKK